MQRFIILTLLVVQPLRAVISVNSVWEVRPATGSDNNGGGFVTGASGTDWSQQAAAQYSLTGLTTTGASATIVTTSAAADMVGNLIQITGGTNFTTGFYQIVSQSTGVSITVDRNATTGVGAAGTGAIGGALATVSKAVNNVAANNVVYLKGTYTVTAILAFNINSDFGQPLTINGYSTTRDDGTRATWTTATNSISLIDPSSSKNVLIKNVNFTNTAGTKGTGTTGAAIIPVTANAGGITIQSCSFDGFNVAISADWQNISFALINLMVDNAEIKNSASHGAVVTGSAIVSSSFIHNNTGDGWHISSSGNNSAYNYTTMFLNNVFDSNGGNGITNASSQVQTTTLGGNVMIGLFANVFSRNTGDGVNSPLNHSGSTYAVNNIFWDNGGWGYNSSTSSALVNAVSKTNAFGSNTSGARQNFPVGLNDVTLTASPFTSIGTDFSLNSTAGGGALLKGVGYPGATSFGSSTHRDIGPLQSASSSSGGQKGFPIVQ